MRNNFIDRIGRWMIAFESREVGEVRPAADWFSDLQIDLRAYAGELDGELVQLFSTTRLKDKHRTLDKAQLEDFVREVHGYVVSQFQGSEEGADEKAAAQPKIIRWQMGYLEVNDSGEGGTLVYSGKRLELCRRIAFALAKVLAQRFPEICTYEELRSVIRKNKREGDKGRQGQQKDNDVQRQMSFLRPELGRIGLAFQNVRGTGYKLTVHTDKE